MNLPFHIDLSNASRPTLGPNPVRDWFILLGVMVAVLLASVGWNYYLYKAAEAGVLPGASQSATPALDPALGGKVDAVFSARASEMTQYENGAHAFIDPSP